MSRRSSIAAASILCIAGLAAGPHAGTAMALGAGAATLACDPPIPAPGQTVVWGTDISPIEICSSTTIPEGAVVEMAPGTELIVHSTLNVDGELRALGTAAAPIQIGGDGQAMVAGSMDMEHATVTLDINGVSGQRTFVRLVDGVLPNASDLAMPVRDALVVLQDVIVENGFITAFSQLSLIDVDFPNAGTFANTVSGYAYLQNVTVNGGPIDVLVDYQPRYFGNVDVVGNSGRPTIILGGEGSNAGSNLLLDSQSELSGGRVPVLLESGGLHPESFVSTTGAARNAIELGVAAASGVSDIPDLGLPYYLEDDVRLKGRARFAPGTTFLQEDFASFLVFGDFFNDTAILRGSPEEPLYIRPASPAATPAGVALFTGDAQYLDVSQGRITSTSGFNTISECTVRDSPVGIFADRSAFVEVRGSQLYDNDVGIEDDASRDEALNMRGDDRPNIIEGNTIGARNNFSPSGATGPFEAQHNWWGHPSGPFSPDTNPDGQGDEISFGVAALPWRTERPDLSDTPPYIDLHWPFILAEAGDTLLLRWDARDDGDIVSQRIMMDVSGGGAFRYVTLLDDLPGDQRTAFVTIPDIGATADARSSLLRVEATDDSGYVGYHEVTLQVPTQNRPDGSVRFTTDTSAGFVPREQVDICYNATGLAAGNASLYLVIDTEENTLKDGPSGSPGTGCSFSTMRFPAVSTNRVRFLLFSDGVGNDNDWYFSEPFEVRPVAQFPDRPPQAEMLTPTQGDRFTGGQTIPMTWTASDDERLREFRIQISLNDGRTWSTFDTIAGDRRSYDLRLPELDTTLDAVRVRVVAVDKRFQSTAAGDDRTIVLLPGDACVADFDGDGVLTLFDFLAFQNAFDAGDPRADLDGDGSLTIFDFLTFQNEFDAGC